MLTDPFTALVDLVLPARCAGCEYRSVAPLCPECVTALGSVQPQRVRPDPEPSGLPPTYALAAYGGALRGALLRYKEENRHGLAGPLGGLLAGVIERQSRAHRAGCPVLLVPVPATAAAARRRHGDHIVRLADRAATLLRRRGVPAAVAHPLRALPRVDSAGLSAIGRAVAAEHAFALRPGRSAPAREAAIRAAARAGAAVVVVDDIVTTGVTLVAAAGCLTAVGIPVAGAAVLAATQRRSEVLYRT